MESRNREVVSMFYKDASKRVWLNSLVVLQEEKGRDGKAYVSKQYWDVDYSKKFGYIFHMSGFSGHDYVEVSGIYHVTVASIIAKRLLGQPRGELTTPEIVETKPRWVDSRDKPPFEDQPRTQQVRKRNRTRRLPFLPKEFRLQEGEDLLDWLENNAIDADAVYCSTCNDFLPGNDYDLCEHCWWCDTTGDYSTPSDRCDCKDREACSEG